MPVVDEPARVEPETYPWHTPQWTTLTHDLARLPHGLLLHGQPGLGKHDFALRLARFLLCQHRTDAGQACGVCRSCELFRAGSHPDLLRVEPLEDSRNILVDQVRAVTEFLSLTPHSSQYKVAVIAPADAMNVNAANCLLKILEEPPSGSVLMLVASHPARVPSTVRSRCAHVDFGVPPRIEARAWLSSRAVDNPDTVLAYAGGAPLAALGLAQTDFVGKHAQLIGDLSALAAGQADPVTCAERWKSTGTGDCLDVLHRFGTDLIRSGSNSASTEMASFPLSKTKILSLSIIDLFRFIDKVSIVRRQLGSGIDETLMLEELLIDWCELTARAV